MMTEYDQNIELCAMVLLDNLAVTELVNKFPASYEILTFICVYISLTLVLIISHMNPVHTPNSLI